VFRQFDQETPPRKPWHSWQVLHAARAIENRRHVEAAFA